MRSPARLGATLIALIAAAACGAPADDGGAGADSGTGALAGEVAAGVTACVPAGALVTGDAVGTVRVGDAVADVRDACAARDTSFTLGEGMMEEGLAVGGPGIAVVAMHTGGDRVTRVIVSAPGPATATGVGVGSTVAEVRRAYPRSCVLVGEGRLVIAVAGEPGLSLGTSADFGSLVRGGNAPSLAALPDSARVTSLWAVGSASGVCH